MLNTLLTLGSLIADLAIAAGVIVAIVSLKQQGDRESIRSTVETLWRFDDRWASLSMRQFRAGAAVALIEERAGRANVYDDVRAFANVSGVMNFFDQLGHYVKAKVIAEESAWEDFSEFARHYWRACEHHVRREQSVDKTVWEDMTDVVQRFEKIDKRRGVPALTDPDVRNFLEREARLPLDP